eukprot:15365469-Ditylum_brightwellii.AAC.1
MGLIRVVFVEMGLIGLDWEHLVGLRGVCVLGWHLFTGVRNVCNDGAVFRRCLRKESVKYNVFQEHLVSCSSLGGVGAAELDLIGGIDVLRLGWSNCDICPDGSDEVMSQAFCLLENEKIMVDQVARALA